MAIEAGDFKTGLTLIIDGDPWQVLDFQHVKPGKGAAILRTKMKNLRNGNTLEKNYNANVTFEQATITRRAATYTYVMDDIYYFMDSETYETYELTAEQVGTNKYYLVESMSVYLVFFEEDLLTLNVPDKVELIVEETTPAIKGAPSTQTKDAVTNTGLTLRVPQFIDQGEHIIVSTADGSYSSRA